MPGRASGHSIDCGAPTRVAVRFGHLLDSWLGLFVIVSPFTAWLALSGWLRLPVVILTAFLPWTLLLILSRPGQAVALIVRDPEDLLLFALLAALLFSTALNAPNPRGLNHSLAYAFAILGYFTSTKLVMRLRRLGFDWLLHKIMYAGLLCCTIIIVEFVLLNLWDIAIRPFFITGGPGTSNMWYFVRGSFRSVGGTAEEPGSMAALVNMIAPLSLLGCRLFGHRRTYWYLVAAYPIALLCLLSVAGIVAAIMGLAFVAGTTLLHWVLKVRRKWMVNKHRLATAFLLTMLLAGQFVLLRTTVWRPLLRVAGVALVTKLTLSETSVSGSIRKETWSQALNDAAKRPLLGHGLGYANTQYASGYHSFFLTLLAEGGACALCLMALFLVCTGGKFLTLQRSAMHYFAIPAIGSLLHLNVIADFYHAPFWLMLIAVQLAYRRQKEMAV